MREENRGKKSEDRKKERSLQELEKEKIQSRSRLGCNSHQSAVSTEGGGRELVK